MPRITAFDARNAARISRPLPRLLHEVRDLASARNELRWMKEAILAIPLKSSSHEAQTASQPRVLPKWQRAHQIRLRSWIDRRSRGEPLQYILGNTPFGSLELLCKPRVLIPRDDTSRWIELLVQSLQDARGRALTEVAGHRSLRIADFCTGSGCISLLLYALLTAQLKNAPEIQAFDIDPVCLELAKQNLQHNVQLGTLHPAAQHNVTFRLNDVLLLAQVNAVTMRNSLFEYENGGFDVIVSNPPYISPQHYRLGGHVPRSVRNFEPKLALVPPPRLVYADVDQADQFYAALWSIARATSCKLLVMEVGDTPQAERVATLMRDRAGEANVTTEIQVWSDQGETVDWMSSSRILTDSFSARAIAIWF